MRYKISFVWFIGVIGFIVNDSHAVEGPAESAVEEKPSNSRSFSAALKCLPLVSSVQPTVGPPSALYTGTCSCSKPGNGDLCPQWSYYAANGVQVQFEQNSTITNENCARNFYLKVNLTSYTENINLKCKLPGFRSETKVVTVKKMGNFRECVKNDDCRYPQQQCLKVHEDTGMVCRCPHVTDLFDPQNPQVCLHFVDLEQNSEQSFLISVLMIVIITVLATAILLLGLRMFPLARCCPGYIMSRNESRLADNTVPFRHMTLPVRADHGNQDLLSNDFDSPPPPYTSAVLANPPDYDESQKDRTIQSSR